MFGLGKYVKMYKAWRKAKPAIDLLSKEGSMSKLKSTRLWLTAGIALVGSVAMQLGMEADQWSKYSEWLFQLLVVYVGGNSLTVAASAIANKKKG